METTITALIGAVGTIIGAITGAVIGNTNFFENLFSRREGPSLVGIWESTWTDEKKPDENFREVFYITSHKGSRIAGYITADYEPMHQWEIEGVYKNSFLQLIWYPSKKSPNQHFVDNGCYFFTKNVDGSFDGFSIGVGSTINEINKCEHKLKLIDRV